MSSPPAPKFVLRGHQAAVHAAAFLRDNERLATGDAHGFVVLWDLVVMRARAVWRAHEDALLGLCGWGRDKMITHGRDHRLIVWQLAEGDEGRMSTALPLDGSAEERPQPWILHVVEVNTMNFCSFAACAADEGGSDTRLLGSSAEILVAVPNTLASEAVDIYSLPSQKRIHTIKPGSANGMAMSLSLLHHQGTLTLIAGFENGTASVHRLCPSTGAWILTYRSQVHSQPILSLDVRLDHGDHNHNHSFFTSGADAIIAKHPIPSTQQEITTAPLVPDERVVQVVEPDADSPPRGTPSLLSRALHEDGRHVATSQRDKPTPQKTLLQEWKHAKKVINTRHSGQQSLEVRSDGGIFATAGWDCKIRVYSCKTMRELAVLKWHKEGAYAVTFSHVGAPSSAVPRGGAERAGEIHEAVDMDVSRLSVTDRRSHRVRTTHWVAAGAKDGRVSLWDVY
ncbi:hypothetical protein E4U42_000175 [Claviceps africana]|uniref:ASTRA-associated protein 1 n=1 Tax=Claviceps africana TaxID=83212 RepID=A0A8K0J0V3_9HYPO|nr:hypothetical protein E4U42_000175 [Claviceps africana]